MLKDFDQHINEHFPELNFLKSIVAVSGGVDSVVLANLCNSIGIDFIIAHCNFNLRGQDSDEDETFVRDLAASFGREVYVRNFQTQDYADEHKISIQMAARELRYQWFDELSQQTRRPQVITAHHADDNLETFLINVLRGTGLKGLLGIPESNFFLLRPLLVYSRKDIEAYAKEHQIQWREDRTNASVKYIRNKLRHDVIPILKEINPQLLQGFAKTQENLKQSHRLAQGYIYKVMEEVREIDEYGHTINVRALRDLPLVKPIIAEYFRHFGFTAFDDIYGLLHAQSGKTVFSPTHRLLKDREKLYLNELPLPGDFYLEIQEGEKEVKTPQGRLIFEQVDDFEPALRTEVFVDKAKIKYPLVVRRWKEGDYFYPFGMKGTKKVSKFFKDNKISLPQKQNCLIMLSGDQIVWVVDHRADDRFRVDEKTTSILKIIHRV